MRQRVAGTVRKPRPLRLSEWADQHFYLSAESSGTEGAWQTLPYQRVLMDLIGGDEVRKVTIQKSKRIGYTKAIVAAAAYWASYKRRTTAIWQPTDSDASEFKKDEVDTALRDVPAFRDAALTDPSVKSKHHTLDRIAFQGALLYVRGGKAARSYARLSLDNAVRDEVDRFDHSIEGAGSSADLAGGRVMQSPFPKEVAGSTPWNKGESQIAAEFDESELHLYRELPCGECGVFHRLEWKNCTFDKAEPTTTTRFACPACGHSYGYESYADLDAAGRWAASNGQWVDEAVPPGFPLVLRDADGAEVAWPQSVGLFIWSAYSYLQSWGQLARAWVMANDRLKRTGDREPLKTLINEDFAETWQEEEGAIDADSLKGRREPYEAIPAGVAALTGGVDTQDDRLEYEVVGHGPDGETWGIEYGVLFGDPADADVWDQLDRLREKAWPHEGGGTMRCLAWGIDSGGHRTKQVYDYCRTRHGQRVYCLKGQGGEGVPIVRTPSKVKTRGQRTVRLYSVGVDALKSWWNSALQRDRDQVGYQHIPVSYTEEWCEQATGEVFVRKFERGRLKKFWKALRARVEGLDCRIYAMAAFHILNPRLDLLRPEPDNKPDVEKKAAPTKQPRPQRRGGYVTRYRQ